MQKKFLALFAIFTICLPVFFCSLPLNAKEPNRRVTFDSFGVGLGYVKP